jgi:hypothetical protein
MTLLGTAGFRERTAKGYFRAYTVLSAVTIDEPDLSFGRLVCHFASNLGRYGNPPSDPLFQEQRVQLNTLQPRRAYTAPAGHAWGRYVDIGVPSGRHPARPDLGGSHRISSRH